MPRPRELGRVVGGGLQRLVRDEDDPGARVAQGADRLARRRAAARRRGRRCRRGRGRSRRRRGRRGVTGRPRCRAASSSSASTSPASQMPSRNARSATVKRSRIRWQCGSAQRAVVGVDAELGEPQRCARRRAARRPGARPGRAARPSSASNAAQPAGSVASIASRRASARACARSRASTPRPSRPRRVDARERVAHALLHRRGVREAAASSRPARRLAHALPQQRGEDREHPHLRAVQRPVGRGARAISSRWLTVCSMPEPGAVRPATPIEIAAQRQRRGEVLERLGLAARMPARGGRQRRRRARARGRRRDRRVGVVLADEPRQAASRRAPCRSPAGRRGRPG